MITAAEYNRITSAKWKGVRVRSLRPITTRHWTLPAGSLFTITEKFSGFGLVADPCSHCGAQFRVSKVAPYIFERVEA